VDEIKKNLGPMFDLTEPKFAQQYKALTLAYQKAKEKLCSDDKEEVCSM
jgi:hypothetical protein